MAKAENDQEFLDRLLKIGKTCAKHRAAHCVNCPLYDEFNEASSCMLGLEPADYSYYSVDQWRRALAKQTGE